MERKDKTDEEETKKKSEAKVNKPLVMELKSILSYILNIQNKGLRRKSLEFAMELLSEIEMDYTKAEKALKAEIKGERKTADEWIEKILSDLDETEYSKKFNK